MVKTVLCFGSLGMEGDDAAFSVCEELAGNIEDVRFVRCESPMDVLGYAQEEGLYIMDAARGIEKVSVFDDIDEFRSRRSVTAHDSDLGMMLEMLSEMGKLPPVRIIGIPIGSNASEAAREVKDLLTRN